MNVVKKQYENMLINGKKNDTFIVYKITNIITNEYYIGNHKTTNKEEEFYGTGRFIRQSIKKYGKENLKFEILKKFNSRKDAKLYTKELVKNKPNKKFHY